MLEQFVNRIQSNVNLSFLIVIGIIWISSIIWVAKDSAQRTNSISMHTISIFLVTVLTPLIGVPLYLLIRPARLLNDSLPWRESLLMQHIPCTSCDMMNMHYHDYCVFCGDQLMQSCNSCGESYARQYNFCYHCGTAADTAVETTDSTTASA